MQGWVRSGLGQVQLNMPKSNWARPDQTQDGLGKN